MMDDGTLLSDMVKGKAKVSVGGKLRKKAKKTGHQPYSPTNDDEDSLIRAHDDDNVFLEEIDRCCGKKSPRNINNFL